MDLTPVVSANIAKVGHDEENSVLYIQFKQGGSTWSYRPVSKADYQLFINSPSLGSFFHKHIKLNPGIKAEKQM